MAQKCTVGGVAYEIKGGRTLVGGVGYAVAKGRTLVGGVVYEIAFGSEAQLPSFSGRSNVYGTAEQGWIELLGSGTLTCPNAPNMASCDLYLLENGEAGKNAASGAAGDGGKGGDWMEQYAVDLRGQTLAAAIGPVTTLGQQYTTSGEANGASGSTDTGTSGGAGRVPFTGHETLAQGRARYKLGAGGGKGASGSVFMIKDAEGSAGGVYGGGAGGSVKKNGDTASASNGGHGTANTGGGGGGGAMVYDGASTNYMAGGAGGTGIVIVRWGY